MDSELALIFRVMPLLPTTRRFAPGGQLPVGNADDNDPTLPATEPARSEEIRRRANQRANQPSTAGSDAAGLIKQSGELAGALNGVLGGGAGAATGAAGTAAAGSGVLSSVASAAGPVGLAIGAGAAVGGFIHSHNNEADGLRNTSVGGQIKDAFANELDPIGTAMSAWKNDKLTTGQKILSSLPGGGSALNAAFTKKIIDQQRIEQQRQKQRQGAEAAQAQTQSVYGGLSQSAQYGAYRRGGLLPATGSRRYAEGGSGPQKATAPALTPAPATHYTVKNPSADAQLYYQNALPTMKKLIGGKYDEVYTDPTTGKQCTANSCLSFASTVQERATGQPVQRTKENLYNPAFTATSEQQGWVQIPVDKAQPGDRFQSWQPVGTQTANEFKVADLQGRQLLPGRVPVHMTVFGGWAENGKPTAGNPGMATVYQDGHQFRSADSQLRPISPNEWVAYRYVGVNGQPTNNPAQAVAPNPAAAQTPPAQPAVAARAKGGLLPTGKSISVIAHGALHSEVSEHHYVGHPTAGKRGIPVLAADGTKLAEVERDELTLSDTATRKLEKLREQGNLHGLGKHLQQELLTNTIPSPRYKKRLTPA